MVQPPSNYTNTSNNSQKYSPWFEEAALTISYYEISTA